MFVGGVRTGSNQISGLPSGTLCMGTVDGSVYLSMTKTGIDIKGNVTITGQEYAEFWWDGSALMTVSFRLARSETVIPGREW